MKSGWIKTVTALIKTTLAAYVLSNPCSGLAQNITCNPDPACRSLSDADITIEAVNQDQFCTYVRNGKEVMDYMGPPSNNIHVLTCHHGMTERGSRSSCFYGTKPRLIEYNSDHEMPVTLINIVRDSKFDQRGTNADSTLTLWYYNLKLAPRPVLAGRNYTCSLALANPWGLPCGELIKSAPVTYANQLSSPSQLWVQSMVNHTRIQWQLEENACGPRACPQRYLKVNLAGLLLTLQPYARSVTLADPDNQQQDAGKTVQLEFRCGPLPVTATGRTIPVTEPEPLTTAFNGTFSTTPEPDEADRACQVQWQAEPFTRVNEQTNNTEAGCSLQQLPGDNCTHIALPPLRLVITRNDTDRPECRQLFNDSGLVSHILLADELTVYKSVSFRLDCQYRHDNGSWGNTEDDTFAATGSDRICLFLPAAPNDSSRVMANTLGIGAAIIATLVALAGF